MTTHNRKASTVSLSVIMSAWRDPVARMLNVDLLTVLLALLLPWSTTGVAIVAILFTIAVIPTLEPRAFLQSLRRPVCILPVSLLVLALAGTLWSDAPWGDRLNAVGPATKFLALPLLLYHYERSLRGGWVFIAFLTSCMLLLVASCIVALVPDLALKAYLSPGPYYPESGIVVKNHIDQGQEFVLCAVALAYPAITLLRHNRVWQAALPATIAFGFLLNMMFVVISRTALATIPFMIALFALLHLRLRLAIAAICVAALLAGAAWNVSPRLRNAASNFVNEYQETQIHDAPTRVGSRLEFWRKSLRFFADAPVIGHGTGSTRGLFEQAAFGIGVHAEIVKNPHNQTLNVAVQWGSIGIIVLYAMWLIHLSIFRGEGFAQWIGLAVVAQNIFTSMFNSHLFDFQEGWIYVLGVGVAGGMTLNSSQAFASASQED